MMNEDISQERRLDGNAAAGPLAELFTVELTAAMATCAGCGAAAPLAAHLIYADAPAMVVRCPICTSVVLRFGSADGRLRLDLTGARLITVDLRA
jgi:hypothetical protein